MPDSATNPAAAGDTATHAAAGIASSFADVARAWSALLDAELALAGRSLRAMLFGALLLPVLLLGCWLSVVAVSILLLHAAGLAWLPAAAAASLLQFGVVLLLVRAMRRWARNLPLPRSRAALSRALSCLT